MQAIQTNNTIVGTVIGGTRVIFDVVNGMADLARTLRGYLATLRQFASVLFSDGERLIEAFVAALAAGLALWHECQVLMPAMAGKQARHDDSGASAAVSRRLGPVVG